LIKPYTYAYSLSRIGLKPVCLKLAIGFLACQGKKCSSTHNNMVEKKQGFGCMQPKITKPYKPFN
jgi:hypothetical protein